MLRIGESNDIEFTVSDPDSDQLYTKTAPLGEWQVDSKKPNLMRSIGLVPYRPQFLPIVGEVVAGSPTELAGMQVADKILSADGIAMASWSDWVGLFTPAPRAANFAASGAR